MSVDLLAKLYTYKFLIDANLPDLPYRLPIPIANPSNLELSQVELKLKKVKPTVTGNFTFARRST